jgi:metal-dependent hydrolase (beta-lactamase superfamily II)
MLSPKNTSAPFAGIARNPTVDLTVSIDTIFKDLDFVIVTHTHSDHFDTLASSFQRHQIILPTCRQRIYGKSKLCKRRVIKQKQPLKILPSQEQAENTRWRILAQMGGFWIRIASRKRTDFIYVGDSIWVEG